MINHLFINTTHFNTRYCNTVNLRLTDDMGTGLSLYPKIHYNWRSIICIHWKSLMPLPSIILRIFLLYSMEITDDITITDRNSDKTSENPLQWRFFGHNFCMLYPISGIPRSIISRVCCIPKPVELMTKQQFQYRTICANKKVILSILEVLI